MHIFTDVCAAQIPPAMALGVADGAGMPDSEEDLVMTHGWMGGRLASAQPASGSAPSSPAASSAVFTLGAIAAKLGPERRAKTGGYGCVQGFRWAGQRMPRPALWPPLLRQVAESGAMSWSGRAAIDILMAIRSVQTRMPVFPSELGSMAGRSTGGAGDQAATAEQIQIIKAMDDARENDIVRVLAYAGTGKTTTLKMLAERMGGARGSILYVAFNRVVVDQAGREFPPCVEPSTMHSLANSWARYEAPAAMRGVIAKLGHSMPSTTKAGVCELLGLPPGHDFADLVTKTLDAYMGSDDDFIGQQHLPRYIDVVRKDEQKNMHSSHQRLRPPTSIAVRCRWLLNAWLARSNGRRGPHVGKAREDAGEVWGPNGKHRMHRLFMADDTLPVARLVWRAAVDPRVTAVRISHSVYLKLWQLARPNVQRAKGRPRRALLLDEAQDISRCGAAALLSAKCPLILVGDTHQSIYSFANAVDTLKRSTVARALAVSRRPPVVLESFGVVLDDPSSGSKQPARWSSSQSAMQACAPDARVIGAHLKYSIGCAPADSTLRSRGCPLMVPDVQGGVSMPSVRSVPLAERPAAPRPTRTLRLTRSFRFGEEIAGFATWVPQKLKGEREPVLGLPPSLRHDAVRLWSASEDARADYPLRFVDQQGRNTCLAWSPPGPPLHPSADARLEEKPEAEDEEMAANGNGRANRAGVRRPRRITIDLNDSDEEGDDERAKAGASSAAASAG